MDYEFHYRKVLQALLANNQLKLHKFKIINYENINSSSRVAAGIMPNGLKEELS